MIASEELTEPNISELVAESTTDEPIDQPMSESMGEPANDEILLQSSLLLSLSVSLLAR